MYTLHAYDICVDRLFGKLARVSEALNKGGIDYRIVGGMATLLHVNNVDPSAARLTNDIDIAIYRKDLDRVIAAAEPAGFKYRHVAGDMLIDQSDPRARGAVHLLFIGEKVRPEYLEPVPGNAVRETAEGAPLAPIVDLVRMKLTSYRDKDRVHVRDLDGVGLITSEVEAQLSPELLARLADIRATE